MTLQGTLEQVPAASLPALREHLDALRHDLGKYMVFQLRWLPGAPSDHELRCALEADLVRTRSAGETVESAPRLWARLRPPLVGERPLVDGSLVQLDQDPDIVAIDRCLAAIQQLLPRLSEAPRAALEEGQRLAMEASGATRRLWKRARTL